MPTLKYLSRKETLFKYCYLAVQSHFESIDALDDWFSHLPSDEKRDAFLKIAPYYLALVKNGDWNVDIPDSNRVIPYFTNTFKYIALMSLIESLSDTKFIDFYSYLIRRRTKAQFPLEKSELTEMYKTYNNEFGSIRRCIGFFKGLPKVRQDALVGKLDAHGVKPTIDNFVKYLYQIRSEFVHNADLVHEFSETPTFSRFGNRIVVCYLSIQDAMEFFEEGLIAWCEK